MTDRRTDPLACHFSRQDEGFLDLGRQFIRTFHLLLKTAQIHDRQNAALEKPVADFQGILDELNRLDGCWELRVRHDYLYLCDVRLKVDFELFSNYQDVLEELRLRRLGAFGLHQGLGKSGLLAFVYSFIAAGHLAPAEDPFAFLAARVTATDPQDIVIAPLEEETPSPDYRPQPALRQRSVLTFIKALCLTREILTAVDSEHVANVRRVKRLVSTFVDIMNVDESVLLGLTNIKNYDEYTFSHSVNVGILAVATGRRLGLNPRQLGELGLAAIFHDVGKIGIPHDIIVKPGRLENGDWLEIEKHPVEGVRKLIQIRGVNEVTNKLIVSVFRHHNNVDGSGYPPLSPGEEIPYFARIIRVADSFDAMTTARAYQRRRPGTVEALEELWGLAGKAFDRSILKVFIATVGIYPVGTVVQLSTGDLGVVTRNPFEISDLLRPVVRAVARWDGREIEQRDIDLRSTPEVEIIGYCAGAEPTASVLDLLL